MRAHTFRFITLLTLLLVPLVWVPSSSAAPPASPAFQRTWERTDKPVADLVVSRTWMWGPQATGAPLSEPYAEAPSGSRMVQYFDKSRMEDNSYRASDPWDVTNGLLVVELMTGKMQVGDNNFDSRSPAQVNVGGDADDPTGPTYATMSLVSHNPPLASGATITQTLARDGTVGDVQLLGNYGVYASYRVSVPNLDHRVASVFWDFMNSSGTIWENGSLVQNQLFPSPFYATGFPVTEAYWANIKVGGTYRYVLLQCFERRCLTYTPDNPTGWKVEAGNVGQHYMQWRLMPPVLNSFENVWTTSAGSLVAKSSANWQLVPGMDLTVNMPISGDMAITYSAETGGDGGRMFVRAVVDGQPASPSDVLFAVNNVAVGAHSFTFSQLGASAGSHTVRIEWNIDSGFTGSVKFRTLSVVASPPTASSGALAVKTPASGPPITTTSTVWSTIPSLSTSVTTPNNSDLAITLSAEAWSNSGGWMEVRAMVDGQEADPRTVSTIFSDGGLTGTHAFTWIYNNVAAGNHTISVQWEAGSGSTGSMGDRTLSISASPSDPAHGGVAIKSASSATSVSTSSQNWLPIPNLSTSIVTPANGTIAITFGAQAWNSIGTSAGKSRTFVRALVDGQPITPQGAYFSESDIVETRSFTFGASNLNAGLHTVEMQWMMFDAGATAYLWNRTLAVVGNPVP